MLSKIISWSAAGVLMFALTVNSWAQQTWTINFKDSDIQELIKFVADVTGKTIIIDPRVKGRIKVISSKPLNEEELMQLFRTTLEMNDFSVVDVENVLRIIPLRDARSAPVPVTTPTSTQKGYLTQVIQLQNISAAKILPSIRPLVPQHSHLSAYDSSNAIIITDTAENIARIRDLIDMLDKSATPITEILELKYANATDLVQVLNSLEKADPSNNMVPQEAVNLTPDKRNNSILITGEDLQRQRMKSLIQRLDRPKAQTGNVRVVYLEYAEAKPVAETLSKVMQNLAKLGPGGKQENVVAATVEADEDTNSLLITASGDDLESLMDVVHRLDIRRAQVLVEAIIAEVGDNYAKNLGVNWLFFNKQNGIAGSTSDGSSGAILNEFGKIDPATASIKDVAGLAGVVGETLGVAGSDGNTDFLALLKALEKEGKSNILSTPSILTMDNQKASFLVGKNIPTVSGQQALGGSTANNGTNGFSNPFQTIQREDVGIKLTVTPQINEGDNVLMKIEQEVSSVDTSFGAELGLVTNKRKVETQVLANDGETIVLGGLIEDRVSRAERRVPILGRIPLIGQLFRTNENVNDKTNLMIFIRAKVVRDAGTMEGLTNEKYKYIRNEQTRQRDGGYLKFDDKRLPILPELENNKIPGDAVITPAAKKSTQQVKSAAQDLTEE